MCTDAELVRPLHRTNFRSAAVTSVRSDYDVVSIDRAPEIRKLRPKSAAVSRSLSPPWHALETSIASRRITKSGMQSSCWSMVCLDRDSAATHAHLSSHCHVLANPNPYAELTIVAIAHLIPPSISLNLYNTLALEQLRKDPILRS